MKPICCGVPSTPVRETFQTWKHPSGYSWVMYFVCKKCKRKGVPFDVDGSKYRAEVEEIRQRLKEQGEI